MKRQQKDDEADNHWLNQRVSQRFKRYVIMILKLQSVHPIR